MPKSIRRFTRPMLLLGVVAVSPVALSAQSFTLAGGYGTLPGSIGDGQSDHGPLARLGAGLAQRGAALWSVEGEIHRQNEHRIQDSGTCLRPDNSLGPCFFDSRWRDTGWALSTNVRLHAGRGTIRPYGLLGLGVLHLRTFQEAAAVDELGNDLPNYSVRGTTSSSAMQVQVGGGLVSGLASAPVQLFVEARGGRVYYVGDGSPIGTWNPSAVVGLRVGRGR